MEVFRSCIHRIFSKNTLSQVERCEPVQNLKLFLVQFYTSMVHSVPDICQKIESPHSSLLIPTEISESTCSSPISLKINVNGSVLDAINLLAPIIFPFVSSTATALLFFNTILLAQELVIILPPFDFK